MYKPNPIDTSDIVIPEGLMELTEKIAENVHENWAAGRIAEGWGCSFLYQPLAIAGTLPLGILFWKHLGVSWSTIRRKENGPIQKKW